MRRLLVPVKVEGKSIVLGTSSLLDLDLGSVTEVTSAQLTGLTGLVSDDATSKGLIDIGATQIKEVKESITNGKIEYSKLSAIAGVTNDTVKSVTVTKVGESISGKDAIYGTIEQEDTAAPSKNFTITDVSLTLTGTGNPVSYTNTTDGKKFRRSAPLNSLPLTPNSSPPVKALRSVRLVIAIRTAPSTSSLAT